MWDQDKTGVTRSKPTPGLYNVDLGLYQDAADYVRGILLGFDYAAVRAELDPYLRTWTFYDTDGEILARVRHEEMDRLYEVQRRKTLLDMLKRKG